MRCGDTAATGRLLIPSTLTGAGTSALPLPLRCRSSFRLRAALADGLAVNAFNGPVDATLKKNTNERAFEDVGLVDRSGQRNQELNLRRILSPVVDSLKPMNHGANDASVRSQKLHGRTHTEVRTLRDAQHWK